MNNHLIDRTAGSLAFTLRALDVVGGDLSPSPFEAHRNSASLSIHVYA